MVFRHIFKFLCILVGEGICHIGEVVTALLISTKPPLIRGVPRWVAREAGPAGRSSRAGGARAAGPAGERSRAAGLVAREAGPAGQKLQLASLVLICFPHLSQSQRILPFCPLFIILFSYGLSSIPSFFLNWVITPPSPSHRREGMGASLEALRTLC